MHYFGHEVAYLLLNKLGWLEQQYSGVTYEVKIISS